jgi:multidrug efflux pump subunit AcrA (membrane-fusion protein)
MNDPRLFCSLMVGLCVFAFAGCKSKHMDIPELAEEAELEQVKRQDFTETAPGYGIYSEGMFQVNIEAEDAPMVQAGQSALVQSIPSRKSIPCRVTKILRSVTAETRQGVAWLHPLDVEQAKEQLRDGDFIFASITTRVKHGALAISRRGVFIKESKTWAIEQEKGDGGKVEFKAVEIEVGTSSDDLVEIIKGLSEGQSVAVGGGIGFLYPEFKAASED